MYSQRHLESVQSGEGLKRLIQAGSLGERGASRKSPIIGISNYIINRKSYEVPW